ncbi:MAG: type II secretion system protein M [Gammaproteobacteria bacterium]|nr:type II secretion system protein M [Gammaproteobacteria bacterium]
MKEWFDSLEEREKYTLAGGAVFLLVVALWLLIINPLYSGTTENRQRIDQLRTDLARATVLNAEIKAQQQSGGGQPRAQAGNQSLMILLQRSATSAGLEVNRSRPLDENTVRVQFEGAAFDALVGWMAAMVSRYGVSVDIASVERTNTPGMVDAQLTIKRPAT